MLVSTSTEFRTFDYKTTLKMMKDAGFTAFDLSLCDKGTDIPEIFAGDDYVEVAKEVRAFADSIGLPCNQSHAVFASHLGAATPDTPLFKNTVRCMEIAAIMGARAIVIHPMQYVRYIGNAEFLKKENLDFYNNLLPYAEKFGIIMLTENMWQFNPINKTIVQSTCADPNEFAEYVDMINSPYLKACLDIGHAVLVGESVINMIRTLGPDRIYGLHIHDVDTIHDNHTLPYTQKVDFEEMLNGLAEIGYTGDITFEAGVFPRSFPTELKLSAWRLMADVGHYFVKEIEKRRAALNSKAY